MPAPDNEPRALAVDMLSDIISAVRQGTPTRSNDQTTQGFVYSQLRVGQMISPRDFARPWSPIGGVVKPGTQAAPTDGSATPPDPNLGEIVKRAVTATMNTEALVDTMLVVTDDGTMTTYSGGGRHLGFQYKAILDAMEAKVPPDRPQAQKDLIAAADQVLFNTDGTDTDRYRTYKANQRGYTKARSDFLLRQTRLLADPATAEIAPQLLIEDVALVKQARDRWKAQGAEEIEAALALRESLGVPLEQGAIAAARELYDSWNIPLLGVPASQPYSYILPSDWAQLEVDDIGWSALTITSNDYRSHFEQHGFEVHTADWQGQAEQNSGHAGISVFGFGFNGSYSEASSNSSSDSTNHAQDGTTFHNDAQNLSISLEYGLCQINRPWLLTDIFHLKNWFLTGQKAGVISSGRITDQVLKEDPLLPIIPTHFLMVRNVRISAEHWNQDGQVFEQFNSKFHQDANEHSSTISGGVEIPMFGPIALDFGASHSESGYHGTYRDESGHDFSNDYKSHFDGTTLEIRGAQIIAWLSEVLPLSPPMDDPALGNA